jgi:predicted lipoprotein with Yx(FWY)xxD motif
VQTQAPTASTIGETKEADMTRTKLITLLVGTALAVAGCGGGSNDSAAPTTANGQPATIGISNTNLGKILVNSQGHTLYLFQKDSGNASACTGACASAWPPLRASGNPTVGSGTDASLVGMAPRPDGSSQVTYNGHRVYLFQNDHKAGDTNGEGLNAFGGNWFALSSAGNQVTAPPNSGGYGY